MNVEKRIGIIIPAEKFEEGRNLSYKTIVVLENLKQKNSTNYRFV
ncbi:hypothetical protein FLAVO9AF_10031 [Flavobacterium sp. 9AF]|nr:hypothetical protein FLAVO9AF_10031 [Flavobacterium sp. 9AF]